MDVLNSILKNDEKCIIIEEWAFQKEKFLTDFVRYLNTNKNRNNIFGNDWWHHPIEYLMLDNKYILSYNNRIYKDSIINTKCDFADEFVKYFKRYHTSIENQIELGLLTRNTVKLVPENSLKVYDAIEKHLEIENDWDYENISGIDDNIRDGRIRYSPYQQAPEPIGGFWTIQRSIIYPEKAIKKQIEGTVVLSAYILPNGIPDKIKVLKPLHPILDREAIRVIGNLIFTPAKQRDSYVGVYISIPVVFNIEKYKENDYGIYRPEQQLYDKDFTYSIRNGHVVATEENFDSQNSINFIYQSNEFYEMLIENTEMIRYVYELYLRRVNEIEIVFEGKSYHINL